MLIKTRRLRPYLQNYTQPRKKQTEMYENNTSLHDIELLNQTPQGKGFVL